MILTLTPNPSLDLLFDAGRLAWDDANRLPMPRRRIGGQGVNVARAVRALDPTAPVLAVAPLGGRVGRELREMLAAEGTPSEAVRIGGETRVFVGVRERETGRALLLNPRGPDADPELPDRLLAAVDRALAAARPGGRGPARGEGAGASGGRGGPGGPVSPGGPVTPGGTVSPAGPVIPGGPLHSGGWVACCGSLLPGLPPDFYARVGALARAHGFRFVPDCDGEPLALALEAGPALLVPNAHEAGRLVGHPVDGVAAAATAARELLESVANRPAGRALEGVLVTLGEDGAVGVDPGGGWWARPRLPRALAGEAAGGSAVGAGDAFLAALLLALDRGAALRAALAEAVATGTATLLGRGGELVSAVDVERVRAHVVVERLAG